jgi:hypothetical protein
MARSSKAQRALLVGGVIWLGIFSNALGAQPAPLDQVALGWNSSPDPTVVGYYLYYGGATGVYTNKVDVGTNTIFSVTGLVPGSTYYFTTTAYNAARMESAQIPEVSYVVPGTLTVTPNPTDGSMRVQFPVAPAQTYQLQASFDLKTWTNLWLTPIEATNGWIEYDDPPNAAIPAKFYRLIMY